MDPVSNVCTTNSRDHITQGILDEYQKVYTGVMDFRDAIGKILKEIGMASAVESLSTMSSLETPRLDHMDTQLLTQVQQLTAVVRTVLAAVTDTISNIFSGNVELPASIRVTFNQPTLLDQVQPKTEVLDAASQEALMDLATLVPVSDLTFETDQSPNNFNRQNVVPRKSARKSNFKDAGVVDADEDEANEDDLDWTEKDGVKRKSAKVNPLPAKGTLNNTGGRTRKGVKGLVRSVKHKRKTEKKSVSSSSSGKVKSFSVAFSKRRKKKSGLQVKERVRQKEIKCELCSELFDGRRELGHHLRRVHPEQTQQQCAECDKVMSSMSALRNHMRCHSDKKTFNCSQCQYASRTYRELKVHTIRVHKGVKDHLCSWCGKDFAVACALNAHVRLVHHKDKPHHCEECGARFLYPSRLAEHRNTVHSKELQFACEFCGSRFFYDYQLKKHKHRHHSDVPVERPYQCEQCPQGFFSPSELKVHRRVHTKERPFRCGICGAGFAGSNGYNRHLRIHTGVKEHECQICHKSYRDSWSLKNHMQSVHSGEKPFQCDLCSVKFSHRNSYTSHMKRHTAQASELEAGGKNKLATSAVLSDFSSAGLTIPYSS